MSAQSPFASGIARGGCRDDTGVMECNNIAPQLVNVHDLAERLNLPARWLRAEALAGRLPVLRVGRRLRFNVDAVEQALLERAAEERHGAPA